MSFIQLTDPKLHFGRVMSYSKKILLGSISRVVNMTVNVVVGFFLMPIIIHSLGDRIFGFWTLVANIIGYYGLLDLGIVSAVQFYVAKSIGEEDREKANQTISTAFFIFLTIGIVIFLVTIVISAFTWKFVSSEMEQVLFKKVLLLMGIGFAIGFPGRAFIGVISANLKWELISFVNILCLIIRTTAIWIYLKNNGGIVGLALIVVIVDIVSYVSFFAISKLIHYKFKISTMLVKLQVLKDLVNYSVYTFIFKTGDQLRFFVDSVVIGKYIGLTSVTHYSIASRLSIYFMDFMIALINYTSPFFSVLQAKKGNEYIKEVYVISSKIAILIGTFVSAMLIFYGKTFITLWVGADYVDSYMVLIILVFGMFFEVSQLPSSSYLFGVAKHKYLSFITCLEGGLNLIISLILVKKYGIIGVACGTTIPMVFFKLIILPNYVLNHVGLSKKEYYMDILFVSFLTTILPNILIYNIISKYYIINSFTSLIASILFQFVVSIPIVYIFVLSREEKSRIIRIFSKSINPIKI